MAAIKGRTLKLRDAADVQKQIEKVMKKTVKGCNVGDILQSEGFAQIDNDGKFASTWNHMNHLKKFCQLSGIPLL